MSAHEKWPQYFHCAAQEMFSRELVLLHPFVFSRSSTPAAEKEKNLSLLRLALGGVWRGTKIHIFGQHYKHVGRNSKCVMSGFFVEKKSVSLVKVPSQTPIPTCECLFSIVIFTQTTLPLYHRQHSTEQCVCIFIDVCCREMV